jgi:hypothetical protein
MAATEKKAAYTLEITGEFNSRARKATVIVRDAAGTTRASDTGNLSAAKERRSVAIEIAKQLGDAKDAAKWEEALGAKWRELLDKQQNLKKLAEAGSPEAVALETCQLLDAMPLAIYRPLSLIGGVSRAVAQVPMQRTTTRTVDEKTGTVREHNPPLVRVEPITVVIQNDGTTFSESSLPGGKPLAELGLEVRLPGPLPPGTEWSGAGIKRFMAGERPNPVDVFLRLVRAHDHFIDFARSLADQKTMAELGACYSQSTWMLDGLNVIGFPWYGGEKGAGKTSALQVTAETSFLGQTILAGSTYPCLRDWADMGGFLGFDDAEGITDFKRADPDKRNLMLSGSRRGAYIAVKELKGDVWFTRHIHTFCGRGFSAIRLPDDVLGSRSIYIPLVRSSDPRRAKMNPMNPVDWPFERRQLIDDLWAVALVHLPEIPKYDRLAAEHANLCGRALDPWRSILAVAFWLEDRFGVQKLYERLEKLSQKYQLEQSEIEESDRTRILFRALLQASASWNDSKLHNLLPKTIADQMNLIASQEDLAEPDQPFTSARKVGWLLKRHRFRRSAERKEHGKTWEFTREEIEKVAGAYGVEAPV